MSKKNEILLLLSEGKSYSEISSEIGCSKSTISFHAKNANMAFSMGSMKRYNWAEVQTYYDAGHGMRACSRHFGFCNATWSKAIERGDIVLNGKPTYIPLDQLLIEDSPSDTQSLKKRLYNAGIKQRKCEECGVESWNGKDLSFDLHHVNGINDDHRLGNLKILCPNCHSQTPSYKGGNKKASKKRKM